MISLESITRISIDLPESVCIYGVTAKASVEEDEQGNYVEYVGEFGGEYGNDHMFRVMVWLEDTDVYIRSSFDGEDFVKDEYCDPDDAEKVFNEVCEALDGDIRSLMSD